MHLRLNILYFWDITSYWLVRAYRYHRFGGPNSVHLRGSRSGKNVRYVRVKPVAVVVLFSAQPSFVVYRGNWKDTTDFQGIARGEGMWEESGANDLLSRYLFLMAPFRDEALNGAIADLRNRYVRLAAVEPLSAYPDYIAVLTGGSCVQGSTGCLFVNDHVSSYHLHSFNCEINVMYTYLIQLQS
jgi:hypothetical protein